MYSGDWTDSYSTAFVQQSLRRTSQPNASVLFVFTGTGIEWFGSTSPAHGRAEVYIDGNLVQIVDLWSGSVLHQQRNFWRFDLLHAKHVLKIVNIGTREGEERNTFIDLDALVVTRGRAATISGPPPGPSSSGSGSVFPARGQASQWTLVQNGSTGVHAMQLVVISPTHALIIDKVEHNPLTIDGHPAWAALYNLNTHTVRPIDMRSNSFCAGGSFLSNGSLISVGGNPVVNSHTAAADFGDVNGMQAIRIFEPCDSDTANRCSMYEDHDHLRMASSRWYNTVVRIDDGSAMIIGGSKRGGWINNATVNNPTVEYFPAKSIHRSNGLPIHLPFFEDTLNANLFPIAFSLPNGKVFMAANRDAMIYDWVLNTEQRLPRFPNGVRVTYPMTGTGVLLPLRAENNYAAEILICGGSTLDDHAPPYELSSQTPASAQCVRMELSEAGIARGWDIEEMPDARMMPDAVLLPTGEVLIVNGAGTGISGYGNVKDQIGASNADHPVFAPVLYNPAAPLGKRFSGGIQASKVPRMYHSVATLTPNGDIMVAGSNPNLDRSEIEYGTEYRVEWFRPPYMEMQRPAVLGSISKLGFGTHVDIQVRLPPGADVPMEIKVALMDLGFVTHAVHANSRLVYLETTISPGSKPDERIVRVAAPPSGNVYPPGPGWIYMLVNGVPSVGVKVMVGSGEGPAVDRKAMEK
ncbi:copper radical oxidase [Infundibulicybe gibba]|nr:copper radical oxidase [Infundibulicybe gibba]